MKNFGVNLGKVQNICNNINDLTNGNHYGAADEARTRDPQLGKLEDKSQIEREIRFQLLVIKKKNTRRSHDLFRVVKYGFSSSFTMVHGKFWGKSGEESLIGLLPILSVEFLNTKLKVLINQEVLRRVQERQSVHGDRASLLLARRKFFEGTTPVRRTHGVLCQRDSQETGGVAGVVVSIAGMEQGWLMRLITSEPVGSTPTPATTPDESSVDETQMCRVEWPRAGNNWPPAPAFFSHMRGLPTLESWQHLARLKFTRSYCKNLPEVNAGLWRRWTHAGFRDPQIIKRVIIVTPQLRRGKMIVPSYPWLTAGTLSELGPAGAGGRRTHARHFLQNKIRGQRWVGLMAAG